MRGRRKGYIKYNKKYGRGMENGEYDESIHDIYNDKKITFGQRVADKLSTVGGSWAFILSFAMFLVLWIVINSVGYFWGPFDPYPFILLNLILSCVAAIQAPIIMMSQNRLDVRDRMLSEKDYFIDLKTANQIKILDKKFDKIIKYCGLRMIEEEKEEEQ